MRRSVLATMVIAPSLLLASYVGAGSEGQQGSRADKEAICRAGLIAYAANADAFPFYTCTYRVTKGQAKSVRDALEGKVLNARHFDNRLIVDGARDHFITGLA